MEKSIDPVVSKETSRQVSEFFGSFCRWIEYIAMTYALMIIAVILPLRYAFLDDMVDCVMDGLQNRSQLQNDSHLEKVASFCGIYGIPPNYVSLNASDNSLFTRIEPRNQTFVESMDYFLKKEKTRFDFTASWLNLMTFLFCRVCVWIVKIQMPKKYYVFEFQCSFVTLLLLVSSKMLTFGQTKLFAKSGANFGLFLSNLLTVPTIDLDKLNGTKLNIISKEQVYHSFSSNSTRYLDLYLRTFFDWSIQVHCLLYPKIFYLMIAVFLFYFYQIFKPNKVVQNKNKPPYFMEVRHKSEVANNISVLPTKKLSANPKRMTRRIGGHVWNICIEINFVFCVYETLDTFLFLLTRYVLAPDMVDCVMDGVQNVTQLQNATHMERVRSFCGISGVPPNYVNLSTIDNSLLMRIEPRNQTFIESMDYFLARQNECFNFKMSFAYLIGIIFLKLLALLANICKFDSRWLPILAFLSLQVLICGKMLAFGQLELFLKSDFKSFWNSLITVPTGIGLAKEAGSISKEQISHALHSNEIQYQDDYLRILSLFSTAFRFVLWPTIFYVQGTSILLQILVLSLLLRKTDFNR